MANRQWTVMVYLGADNNLSVDFLWDLKEMQEVKEVGPDEDKAVAVVAQYDPGQGLPTQRYVINKESAKPEGPGKDGWLILDRETFANVELEELLRGFREENAGWRRYQGERLSNYLNRFLRAGFGPNQDDPNQDERLGKYLERLGASSNQKEPRNKNTGDPLTLLEFICWGIDKYPAPHYMVVLAGHGSGAVGDFLLKDNTSKDSLTLHELKDVFQLVQRKLKLDGRKKSPIIDVLGMDSCLMSMVEVYYQLRGSVSYLVGAEGFEPTSGWPYQRILRSLVKERLGPTDFAKQIVDDYVLYYFDYALAGLSVNLAACDIEEKKTKQLADAVQNLGRILKSKLEHRLSRSVVVEARQKAQSYKFDQYVDLWDFCHQLESDKRSDQALKDCCSSVRDAIEKEGAIESIVLNSSYVGPDYQNSHGLSVYFPWNSVPKDFSDGYEKLVFAETTDWGQFVKKFTEEIRALQLVPSNDIAIDESNTRYAGKTLHSARTLYSGENVLYSGENVLYSGENVLYSGENVLGPLYLAYSKAPSLVWKPPKGRIEEHVKDLVILNQIQAALTLDVHDRRVLLKPKKIERRQRPMFFIEDHLQDLGSEGLKITNKNSGTVTIKVYGCPNLMENNQQKFRLLREKNADVKEFEDLWTDLRSQISLSESLSAKVDERLSDLTEFLGVLSTSPKTKVISSPEAVTQPQPAHAQRD